MPNLRSREVNGADAWVAIAEREAAEAVHKLTEAIVRAMEKVRLPQSTQSGRSAGLPLQSAVGQTSVFTTPQLAKERDAILNLNSALIGTQGTLRQFVEQHGAANAIVQKFGEAMGRNIVQASTYGRSIRQAAMEAARATVESIAAKSLVEAIYSTAFGFLHLAEFDFAAAAQAFEAAAIFSAVGGAAAGMGAVLPSSTGHRAGAGWGYGRGAPAGGYEATGPGGGIPGTLAAGAQSAAAPAGGLTVAIMGNEEAGQWLATTLNQAVTQQGVQLVSSASQRGAPVGH